MCAEKRKHSVDHVEVSDEEADRLGIYHVVSSAAVKEKGYKVSLNIKGKQILMRVYTGATVTSVPEKTCNEHFEHEVSANTGLAEYVYWKAAEINSKGNNKC